MTLEEILAKHVFGEDQEMRSLFYMDRFSADLVETNDTIYDAMREYASQQSAALESENKELRKVLTEATAQRELRHEAWLEELNKRQEFEKVLKELVELKDMKELIEADNFSHIGDYNFCKSEYETRKPLAWESARKLVKQ